MPRESTSRRSPRRHIAARLGPFAWTIGWALLGVNGALAQAGPAPRFGEVVDVPLVELELLVAGRDGAPVDDLGAAEIKVFEDGTEVALTSFERLTGAAPPEKGTQAAPSGIAPDRYVAVFLDEVHVGPAGRRRLLADLADTLDDRLEPGDRVMVALYDGGTHVALPFSRDRQELRRVLDGAGNLSAARLVVEQERNLVLERAFWDASGESGTSPCLHMKEIVDAWLDQEHHRVRLAIAAFRQFVESLSGIEGRKTIFHVSDGIPLRPGAEAQDYAQELCSGLGVSAGQEGSNLPESPDIYDPGSRTLDDARFDTTRLWSEIAARANAGNVTIYAFQAELGPSRFPSSAEARVSGQLESAHSRAIANLQEPLFILAEGTGGRAALGGGDLRRELGRAIDELRGQYLLSYTPPTRAGNDLRRIRVEVARPGVAVRHRQLYRPQNLDDQIGNQLLGRLLYGEADSVSRTGFQLELGQVVESDDDLLKARFRVGLPLNELVLAERDGGREGIFSVFLSVAAEDGGISSVRKAVVPVKVDRPAQAAKDRFVWEVEIQLRPGRQRLGVAVRDEIAGTTTFLVRSFDLPNG
jgi:VWFA-related protein